MISIPSRYSIRHYVDVRQWARQRIAMVLAGMPSMFAKPVDLECRFAFIVGCGHSGTTLAATRLGAHPEIMLIGRESNAFSPAKGLHCTRNIVREWAHFANASEKKMVLEKTPKHVQRIGAIFKLIPNAKVVAITRNPLDNVASLYSRYGDLDAAIGRWIVDNSTLVACLGGKYRDNIKVLRYEELVNEPELVMSDLVEFVGLPWSERLIDINGNSGILWRASSTAHQLNRQSQVSEKIVPRVDSWKRVLGVKDVEQVRVKTEVVAKSLGYA
ncbi:MULTISPECIES: sulfotransferase [Halorhodospira]|uniref:sulfotransferase family protein n=1 Tax=Halorhodospira TaxID=85108 RepID=UPI001EE8299F|nr:MULTISPECIES: sulfotransferase [Halorhodospira]MCG5528469.1 sulfotransferase [Halorhodospira halophila]MCG5544518.1 sulfotransferase [Halorhodospira sp. 9628]